MKFLRKIYFRWFKHYRRLEFKAVTYAHADALIRQNGGKPECEQWVIASEEDSNWNFRVVVYIERRQRILS